jgi:alkylation response protein AidB-like acyl-CoA dehydrogenase
VQELGSLGLKLAGSHEQRAAWLPRLASGEVLPAYALTEAGLGLRLGRNADHRAARRRRVGARRHEALHHERGYRRPLHGVRED